MISQNKVRIRFLIKRILPHFIIKYVLKIKTRPIVNHFNTQYKKKALLSYIVSPFKKHSLNHTNSYESQTWALILNELGYQVDIINYNNYNKSTNLSQYDLICGFGDVFQNYFERIEGQAKTIYYGAGMHVCYQNNNSLNRVKDVYKKKSVWLGKSARFVEKTWTHQTVLVDGIIALGNEVCANSYRKYYEDNVLSILAPFYNTQDANEIMNNRTPNANKNFLWFGSTGLIHKGLDLLLDYFSRNSDLSLHVCGPIQNEPDFVRVYKKELYETPNIITYGFIDIKSRIFTDILKNCSFIIFPSCSEGGSPSVVTAIGNGGLIPIITKETTISTGYEIWIDSFDYNAIEKAVRSAMEFTDSEILELQKKNYEYIQLNHSQKNYYDQLKLSISNILENNHEL